MQAELLAARVPRYTSYPTAPHFHNGIDRHVAAKWIGELPSDVPLSLYFHIPFCDSLCWFCACHTAVVNTYSPVRGYLDVLRKELAAVAALVPHGHKVTHIHFGGGSPTMIAPEDFRAFAELIRGYFNVQSDAEFAVEIDPRGLSDETVEALADSGVNRASIGVQDCHPAVQAAINRIQPHSVTRSAVERLRACGVKNLNIDLVYGLPHQSLERLENTIRCSTELDPDRLAIFGYAHVPHFKKHQALIDQNALPGVEKRLQQFEAAHTLLERIGYEPIGLDHFAKSGDSLAIAARAGRLFRNFQGYTTDSAPALIGLGASAISALPQGYTQNAVAVPDYRAAVQSGGLATARGIALSDEDRLRRTVIERLMCDFAVDLAEIAGAAGVSNAIFQDDLARLQPLVAQGVVCIEGQRLSVRRESRVAVRCVCAAFDTYLNASENRHALAV
jgi:oxygen-independent coproporphyrinogen-3 oxidase